MSKSRQQKVKNGKRRIERRLRRKNWSQQDEPMFKANNIHYELSEHVWMSLRPKRMRVHSRPTKAVNTTSTSSTWISSRTCG